MLLGIKHIWGPGVSSKPFILQVGREGLEGKTESQPRLLEGLNFPAPGPDPASRLSEKENSLQGGLPSPCSQIYSPSCVCTQLSFPPGSFFLPWPDRTAPPQSRPRSFSLVKDLPLSICVSSPPYSAALSQLDASPRAFEHPLVSVMKSK